jgi:hypothetical protein
MNISNVSFPHPVLGLGGDYSSEPDVMGEFDAPFEIESGDVVSIKIDYQLIHSTQLEHLIKNRSALFACEVMCKNTAFRSVFTSSVSDHRFEINSSLLSSQIILSFYIIADRDFTYSDEGGWHGDYANQSFEITRGSVLAYGGSAKYQIQREPSGSSFGGSLICVLPGEDHEGPFKVSLESETITIFLPKKTYVAFERLYVNRPDYAATFHASLVVPALMEALSVVGGDCADYRDKTWFQAIDTKLSNDSSLNKFEIHRDVALELAQQLMGCPFSQLTSVLESDNAAEVEV